jgi:hypothetical protein
VKNDIFLTNKSFLSLPHLISDADQAVMAEHGNSEFPGSERTAVDRRVIEEIARALAGLRFGSLEITVHDGRVTQIESKKKIRLS